jgi:hypothetical protein
MQTPDAGDLCSDTKSFRAMLNFEENDEPQNNDHSYGTAEYSRPPMLSIHELATAKPRMGLGETELLFNSATHPHNVDSIPVDLYDTVIKHASCLSYNQFVDLVLQFHCKVMDTTALPNTDELNKHIVQVTASKWSEVNTVLSKTRKDIDAQLAFWSAPEVSAETRSEIENRLEQCYQGRLEECETFLREHIIHQERLVLYFRHLLAMRDDKTKSKHISKPKKMRMQMPTFTMQSPSSPASTQSLSPPPKSSKSKDKKKGCVRGLPMKAQAILQKFYEEHILYPYPTVDQKQELMAQCGISLGQINNWFTNRRCRSWQKDLTEHVSNNTEEREEK